MNDIRTVELFAGIGGFRLGLEKASQRYKTVYANEWEKNAVAIYRKNFGEKELFEGDITKVDANSIPDHELLVGGFPCQPFSLAGERKGFSDIRGTLFFEIARIAECKRPKVLFLENVKGLLSAQNGFCFLAILDRLDELGYNVEWKVLNTKNWLPQNRERVIIIATLRGSGVERVYPFECYGEEDSEVGQIAGCLQGGGHSGGLHSNMTALVFQEHSHSGPDGKGRGIRVFEDVCPTLPGQMGTGGNNVPMIAKTVRSGGRGSLDRHSWDVIEQKGQLRRFTEIECERLQGFPDNWTQGVSRTHRYHCLGNAVSVPVIQYIGQLLLEAF